MRLTRDQSQKLLHQRNIWITEACDKCGQLLGAVRWTRRGEPGESCSIACRDGIQAGVSKSNSKGCLECGTRLDGKRDDAKFCSRTHMMRYRRHVLSKSLGERQIIGNTPIGKQRLTDPQNGGSTNAITRRIQCLQTASNEKCGFAETRRFSELHLNLLPGQYTQDVALAHRPRAAGQGWLEARFSISSRGIDGGIS